MTERLGLMATTRKNSSDPALDCKSPSEQIRIHPFFDRVSTLLTERGLCGPAAGKRYLDY